MNIPYAISGIAIAGTVALSVYHELPPVRAPVEAPAAETIAVKGDASLFTHPVRTIPIIVAPMVVPIVAPPPVAEDPPEQPQRVSRAPRSRGGDVCARHGGERIDDPRRRSWHCVFPKRR